MKPTSETAIREPYYNGFTSEKQNHKKVWSNGLNRALSQDQLERLFTVVTDARHLMCFQMQALLGLAVNEAVRVKSEDIDFANGRVYIYRKKTKNIEFAVLHPTIEELLQDYLTEHIKSIEASGGYLIYNTKSKGHLSPENLRWKFREYREKAGLDQLYLTIKTTGNQRGNNAGVRKLHVYGTHSLKRYYTTSVYQSTRDPNLTRELSRHKQYSTTQEYIGVSEDQKHEALQHAFGGEQVEERGNDMEEFMEFMKLYQVWKRRT